MQKIIGVTELQRNFKSIFDEVSQEGIPYVLTRGSKPEAVLISYEEFVKFQEREEAEVLRGFDRMWQRVSEKNQQYSLEEVQKDIEEARDELE